METTVPTVPYSYTTIRVTRSRIEKGLLAIPRSLVHLFPAGTDRVYVVDERDREEMASFTPYTSTSKECRIGGMRAFYEQHGMKDGDEVVLQARGDNRYLILPDDVFQQRVAAFESQLEEASSNLDADTAIASLAALTRTKPEEVVRSEFVRLARLEIPERRVRNRHRMGARETAPALLRKMLLSLYGGRCQVSGFSFLTKTGKPYFEIHHIDPLRGHHVKNLLVVSPNVHAQFTYARVEHTFDDLGWLRLVRFNGKAHPVFQIVDGLPSDFKKETYAVEER